MSPDGLRLWHMTTSRDETRSPAGLSASGAPPVGGEPVFTGSGPRFDSRFPARLLVALAASGLIVLAVWTNRPTQLSGHLNLVGYGSFVDYNYVWFLAYRLVTYAFPVAVIVIYVALYWRGPLRGTKRVTGGAGANAGSVPIPTAAASRYSHRMRPGLWLRLIPPAIVVGVVVGPGKALSLDDGAPLRIASALLSTDRRRGRRRAGVHSR